MKENIMKLYVQRTIWKSDGRTSLCWVFVFFVNNNKYVDVNFLSTMRCVICYNIPILVCNPTT